MLGTSNQSVPEIASIYIYRRYFFFAAIGFSETVWLCVLKLGGSLQQTELYGTNITNGYQRLIVNQQLCKIRILTSLITNGHYITVGYALVMLK